MDNVFLTTLLNFIGTLFGGGLAVVASNKLVNYRLDALEKKVDKHNNIIERVYKVESSVAAAHKRMDTAGIGASHEKAVQ